MSRRILRPVTPVMSLTTSGSWRFICTNAFCIRWTYVPALLDEGLPMAHVGAQRDNALGRPKAPAEQADAVQVAEPLAVGHVALASGHVPNMARVHESTSKPQASRISKTGIQYTPVGFHRHGASPDTRPASPPSDRDPS